MALLLLTDTCISWKRAFQFRPCGMDVFGARGPEAKKAAAQFSNVRASRLHQSDLDCRPSFYKLSVWR